MRANLEVKPETHSRREKREKRERERERVCVCVCEEGRSGRIIWHVKMQI